MRNTQKILDTTSYEDLASMSFGYPTEDEVMEILNNPFDSLGGDGGSDNHMFLAIYDNASKMMINYDGNHLSTGNIGNSQRFSSTVTYQTD